jgi:anti-sigma-K factor RskA
MDHEAIKDLLPLAAVDRLELDEARALAEHLRTGCDECDPELRELREAAASMAYALDTKGSEDRIWERLDARLRVSERASARPETSLRPGRPRGVFWRLGTGAFAASSVVLAVYAGIVSHKLGQTRASVEGQIARLHEQLVKTTTELTNARGDVRTLQAVLADQSKLQRILMAPDLRLTRLEPLKPAPDARAIVAVSTEHNTAVIQASGLPIAPSGKVYELWWITKESGPVPAGLFQAEPGHPTIAPAMPPPRGEIVMLSAVTLEPLGGVPKPSGAMYLKGSPG